MRKNHIPGTEGYASAKENFIDATLALDFMDLHKDFAQFFPKEPGRILDIGAGIGRDASAFSRMGHSVTAVEPLHDFRNTGKQLYDSLNIEWIDDALPNLEALGDDSERFDLILVSGVWHHLNIEEQYRSMQRITQLLNTDGTLLLTLRNGPTGAGTHIFPTNGKQSIKEAEDCGLTLLFCLENQPSLMKNKERVNWTKLVFKKQEQFDEVT